MKKIYNFIALKLWFTFKNPNAFMFIASISLETSTSSLDWDLFNLLHGINT